MLERHDAVLVFLRRRTEEQEEAPNSRTAAQPTGIDRRILCDCRNGSALCLSDNHSLLVRRLARVLGALMGRRGAGRSGAFERPTRWPGGQCPASQAAGEASGSRAFRHGGFRCGKTRYLTGWGWRAVHEGGQCTGVHKQAYSAVA